MTGGKKNGIMETLNHWVDKNDHPVLRESRLMEFHTSDNKYTIDFTMTLSAIENPVTFTDTKEGMFANRVADWLAENAKGTLYQSTGEYLTRINLPDGSQVHYY